MTKIKTPAQVEAKKARAKARREAKKKALLPVLCIVEGKEVRKGDFIGFKDDIEQYGRAVQMRSMGLLEIETTDDRSGDKITVLKEPQRCWID